MGGLNSELMQVLTERGFVHQVSDMAGLDDLAAAQSLRAYVGYDCTGPSLHVGNLLSIMMLRWLQKAGHSPITLMGGGTTRVGDPSGKDKTRQILSNEEIETNKSSLLKVFGRFLDYKTGPNPAEMIDNADWLGALNYIDFLRDVGRHFSVNRMLSMESVKIRIDRDQELSFLEFNYMILQAYDFVELNLRAGCRLQLGGSDQWGNIVSGIDLGRRMGTQQLYALTCPLITTSSGAKMGKTAQGSVWLNADMLSPYEYWQFWRDTEDDDVPRFLKLFTELPLDEIGRLAELKGQEINEAKKVLATEATALLHGRGTAESAAETARRTFEAGEIGSELPSISVGADDLSRGVPVLSLFVDAGLVRSNGEARRQIRGGGLRINDKPVSDERGMVTQADLVDGTIKLSVGRKRHALVRRK